MAKKLKRRIEEVCGLEGLDYLARRERAQKILASSDWKQKICNELLGLSFRELERTLQGIVAEREVKHDEEYLDRRDPNRKTPTNGKNVPRSLAEILAQVYAPRVEGGSFSDEERAAINRSRPTRADVLQKPDKSDRSE